MFHCCKCQESGEYDDLQHAYENGWYCNDDAYYCSEHAGDAIEKEDKSWDDVYTHRVWDGVLPVSNVAAWRVPVQTGVVYD